MAIFTIYQALAKQTRQTYRAYNKVTDLLDIPRNDLKDAEGTKVIVFRIEINTRSFTARLLKDKLDKAIKATGKVLAKHSAIFLNIQSLVGFLWIYS